MISKSEGEVSVFDFDVEDPVYHDQNLGQEIHNKGRIHGPSKIFGLGQQRLQRLLQSHRKPCASKHSRIEKQVLSKNSRPDFWVFWAPNTAGEDGGAQAVGCPAAGEEGKC